MNRKGDAQGIPSEISDSMSDTGGRGLEFGCYQQYLAKHWDGVSDMLFMQDDGIMTPKALADIAKLTERQQINQAFIFRDEYEEYVTGGQSGRAFWVRGSLLAEIKLAGGFPVDWDNCGDTTGRQANAAIHTFAAMLRHKPSCCWVAIVPEAQMGNRGWISNKTYQYKRTKGQKGLVTPESVL
jgi:hypothetical protein